MAKRALRRLFSPTLGVARSEPVLAWMVRGIPWLRNPDRTRRVGLWSLSLSFLLGSLLGALLVRFNGNGWIFLALIAARIVLDGLAMTRSWGSLALDYRSGRWDLLRLTTQSEGALLRAHYASAYAGVWRLLIVVLGLQTGALLTIIVSSAVTLADYPESWWVVLPLLGAMVILDLDLLLRTRALAALGLALSASAPRAGIAVVLGGVALILFWFVQVVALATGLFLTSFLVLFTVNYVAGVLITSVLTLVGLTFPLLVVVFVQRVALYRLAVAVDARDAAV